MKDELKEEVKPGLDESVPSLKRSADPDGEPPLKRQAVEGSS